MKRLSIRWSLTLWYGLVLTAILLGFSGTVYMLMRHHLLALTDAALGRGAGGHLGRCPALRGTGGVFSRARSALCQPRRLRVPGEHTERRRPVSQRRSWIARSSDPGFGLSRPPAHTNLTLDGLGPMRLARDGLGPGRAAHRPGRRLAGAERTCIEGAVW